MSKVKNTNTETVKRGRPVVEGSKRQAVLAMRAAKVAAGGEIKRGRPAGTKKTTDVEVVAKTNLKTLGNGIKKMQSKAQKQAEMAKKKAVATIDGLVANVKEAELVEAGLL